MPFEYRDPYNSLLRVEAGTLLTGTPMVCLTSTGPGQAVVEVPLDRVEEVIAGIRDAARTASGQQPAQCTSTCPDLDNPARCVLAARHSKPHRDAQFRWWPQDTTLAVGQPAEAQAADEAAAYQDTARRAHRRLAAVERLVSGRPGYHQITVKDLLAAMSDETVEDER